MEKEAIHIIVSGKVQGVFFRATTVEKAKELYLTGWVKNLRNGDVEILAEGEKENLIKLSEWCKIGSERAVVKSVQTEKVLFKNKFTDFQITY